MDQMPAWIELLFKRENRVHCFVTPFVLRLNIRQIEETLSQVPDDRPQLRKIALQRLGSEDIDWVVIALLALYVVGNSEDAAAVKPLTAHADKYIENAAKTCLFELRKHR